MLLSRAEFFAGLGLISLFLLMSALEVIGVGAVFWFIKLVTEPTVINEIVLLQKLEIYFFSSDTTFFLIFPPALST